MGGEGRGAVVARVMEGHGGAVRVDEVLPLRSLLFAAVNTRCCCWRELGAEVGDTNDKAELGRTGTDTFALKLATMGDGWALRGCEITLKGEAGREGGSETENLLGAYTTTAEVVAGALRAEVKFALELTLALGRIGGVDDEESCCCCCVVRRVAGDAGRGKSLRIFLDVTCPNRAQHLAESRKVQYEPLP